MSDLKDLSPEFIAAVDALRRLARVEDWSSERWGRMVDLLCEDPPPLDASPAPSPPG